MDMFEIEIKYTKKGIISSASCKESIRITLNDFNNYDDRKDFELKTSKVLNLFNNSNYWNIEIYFQTLQNYQVQKILLLVCKDCTGKATYTVYNYDYNSTDVLKLTKKELYDLINEKYKKALENEYC